MTSPRRPVRGLSDYQLDMSIRCAVRERVFERTPSPAVWQRVHAAAQRTGGLRQVWNRLTYHFEAVGVCLLSADTILAAPGRWGRNSASTSLVRYDQQWSRLNRHQLLRLVA